MIMRPNNTSSASGTATVDDDPEGTPDPDVFVIGDAATIEHAPLPATAQVANQQAKYVARRLNRLVRPWSLPSLSSLRFPALRAAPPASDTASLGTSATEKAEKEEAEARTRTGEAYAGAPFEFNNAGSLAYVGGWEAVFDRTRAARGPKNKETGRVAWLLWRSAYFTKTLSVRNKILVPVYW